MLSDEQIMNSVAQGDIRQSGILFERYSKKLYNYYLRTTYDSALSEDLSQQAFEKMIKYRESFRENSSFKSWLFKIASNVKNDHFRKEKSHRNRNQVYSSGIDSAVNPYEKMHQSECSKQIHQALNKLPADQREVIWLTRFEKMKYADVAEMQGCTESAIKVKVHRAMKRLKIEYLQLEKL